MKASTLATMISFVAVWIPFVKGDKQSGQNQRIRILSSNNKDSNRLTTTTSKRKLRSKGDSFDDDIDYFYSMSYSYSYNYDQSRSKSEDYSLDGDNDHFYSMSYSYSHLYSRISNSIPDMTAAPSLSNKYSNVVRSKDIETQPQVETNVPSNSIPDMTAAPSLSNKYSNTVRSKDIETQPQVETNVPSIINVVVQTNYESVSNIADKAKTTIRSLAPTAVAPTDGASASLAAYSETNDDGSTVKLESKANTSGKSLTNGVVTTTAAGLIFAGVILAIVRKRKQSLSDDLGEDFTEDDFI